MRVPTYVIGEAVEKVTTIHPCVELCRLRGKHRHAVLVRRIAIHVMRRCGYSYPETARYIGYKSHSAAVEGYAKLRNDMLQEDNVSGIIEEIHRYIAEAMKQRETDGHA